MGLEPVQVVVEERLRQRRGTLAAGPGLQVAQRVPPVGEVLQAPGRGLAGLDGRQQPGPPVQGVGPPDAVAQRLGGHVAAGVHGGDRAVRGVGGERTLSVEGSLGVLEPLKVAVGVPRRDLAELAAFAAEAGVHEPATGVVGRHVAVAAGLGAGGPGGRSLSGNGHVERGRWLKRAVHRSAAPSRASLEGPASLCWLPGRPRGCALRGGCWKLARGGLGCGA